MISILKIVLKGFELLVDAFKQYNIFKKHKNAREDKNTGRRAVSGWFDFVNRMRKKNRLRPESKSD